MNNRGVNAAQGGYSSQPIFGGPVYFIGNLLYHVPSGVSFKFSSKPAGLLVYHNTIIGEHVTRDPYSNVHFRNNLFISTDKPDRGVMTWANATDQFSSDYNGYRLNPTVKTQFQWLAPQSGKQLYEPQSTDWQSFATLKDLGEKTHQETHSVALDLDVFTRMVLPDPANRHAVYHASDLDFSIRSGSRAIDSGVVLPTVNDGYAGAAPDLGALEEGRPQPTYGPRWLKGQPFYR
jgi:hypothetical protein